jgi:hypothetical protein
MAQPPQAPPDIQSILSSISSNGKENARVVTKG